MAKSKGKQLASIPASKPAPTTITLDDLQQDADLWYRIKILLYDLSSIASDPLSEKRLSSTTNELYISNPYFTDIESTRILSTLITVNESQESIQDAIQQQLATFFEKRRASGDARPCGPHDMVPAYGSVFGIEKGELKDEKFLNRLKRSGLGDFEQKAVGEKDRTKVVGEQDKTKKQKKKAGKRRDLD